MLRPGCPQRARGERGSAIIEFIAIILVLLIPLIYLVLTLARIQAGSYAVATAARESARAFITTPRGANADTRAQVAAMIAFEDQGFGGIGRLATPQCSATPCFTPEATVTTTARVSVPLPLIPDAFRGGIPLSIPLEASQRATVEKYRAVP